MTDIEKNIEEAFASKMPFECWERLPEETSGAFSAFCTFRDFGVERTIRKAIATIEKDEAVIEKRYRVWRNYASKYHWNKRVAEYDRYVDQMKQTEFRKNIEAQGEMHRQVTGKMLVVINKKLDTMNPADLPVGIVTDWVNTAIKSEREMAGLVLQGDKPETKQGEFNFVSDFQGL